mgnify:CR=1 FL=1
MKQSTAQSNNEELTENLNLQSNEPLETHVRWFITNEFQLNEYIGHVKETFNNKKFLTATCKAGRQRTLLQNKSLHKYFKNLAIALNAGGQEYKFQKFFKSSVDIPWTMELVKQLIWKPVQEAMINKSSTVDAKTTDYVKVYDVLNRHLSENYGIHVAWPDKASKNSEV